jgi:hypothetical protein
MPLYLYRWSNSDFSVILADSPEQAVQQLEEHDEEEKVIEAVLAEKLAPVPDFRVDFKLPDTTEEYEDFMPQTATDFFQAQFQGGFVGQVENLYPRFDEVMQREMLMTTAVSTLGAGMTEVWAIYDQALVSERTNTPLLALGTHKTSYPLTMRAIEIFLQQEKKCEQGILDPGDLIFFDHDPKTSPELNGLWEELLAGMKESNISDAVCYATRKTGRLEPSEYTRENLPADLLAEWDAAVTGFHSQQANGSRSRKAKRMHRPMKVNSKGEKVIHLSPEAMDVIET